MSAPPFSVCVYCGSRNGVDEPYVRAAREVGRWIGERGGQLVYGGGTNGLMGTVAQATMATGGSVVGIIPQALVDKEWAKRDVTELHIVETMHDRKRMMAERAGSFLALAGGIGTLEELFEVWTWRQLGYHDKPVGILDTAGYYQPLLAFLGESVNKGFMNDWQMDLVRVGSEAPALLEAIVDASLGAGAPSDFSQI
ncbi:MULTISPECIES: TIGR00730 family Rossman fold protein [Ramlibacter]|uniref:Cytokinin riboside 5'-monophosphate phosphoribohydrolase n=1 Tax=Ramlibacter pinisoli TaxID=2682844 RepID=A0A6N8IWY0_9BURK|nr:MULTISPECIES: TIGR00730 family Rossman fold protein [Ramlibacter]MBA2961217.1 TIGR00730 family Rossman fold protein [Ramlibacter sp. CGMCC 1.13660]MVQ31162.1 TIGR00730 family Rossman fold protein [Ramlibacter pinisoli]